MSSPAKDGSSMTPSPPINSELLLGQRISGMRSASNLSEWQLQAVLFKAKLTQYFDVFISQGGDDIDQIMQCDEHEFLEIMSLVGMASKPLHVRRLQRTLNEFSLNRAQFLLSAVPFIGLPLVDLINPSSSSNDSLSAAFQFLIPGFMSETTSAFSMSTVDFNSAPTTSSGFSTSKSNEFSSTCGEESSSLTNSSLYAPISSTRPITLAESADISTNVLPFPDSVLMSLVGASGSLDTTSALAKLIATTAAAAAASVGSPRNYKYQPKSTPTTMALADEIRTCQFGEQTPSTSARSSGFALNGQTNVEYNSSTSNQLFEIPSLTADEIARLAQFARALCDSMPNIEPRFIQNKKRISKELLNVMSIPSTHPSRIVEFRRFSAIYGRFDAKRKPDKALTFHEALVNEAAAQLCVCRPELLTRRNELFPLSRKLVRLAGFFGPRSFYRQRRNSEDSADDGETALKSGEDQSRTTSRSSAVTNSASPSPAPSTKAAVFKVDGTPTVSPGPDRHNPIGMTSLFSRSLTPEAAVKIGKKRKRASVDL